MHIHLLSYTVLLLVCVTACYLSWKTHKRARAAGFAEGLITRDQHHTSRVYALKRELTELHAKRQDELSRYGISLKENRTQTAALQTELRRRTAFELTALDAIALADASEILTLALQTWKAMPGTQAFQFRAMRHLQQLKQLNTRLNNHVRTATVELGCQDALAGAA